jgi:SAM-dependent methyltransferase
MERVTWLRNQGSWGREGTSMNLAHVDRVDARSRVFRGRRVLEIGTSRGQLSALMALNGCRVTTLDREDRGARLNLEGLDVAVEIAGGAEYLAGHPSPFALIVVDLHGNDEATWRTLWPLLDAHLAPDGELLLYNSHLWRQREWRGETGLRWVMEHRLADWTVEVHDEPPPGMLICRRCR